MVKIFSFFSLTFFFVTLYLIGDCFKHFKGFTQIAEGRVTLKRVREFLTTKQENLNSQTKQRLRNSMIYSTNAIVIKDLTVSWPLEVNKFTLDSLNLSIKSGLLVGVVGPIGSGKTTLLHAILGEFGQNDDSIKVNGKVAYASQEPWIFTATVRQNILFGNKMDQDRFSIQSSNFL